MVVRANPLFYSKDFKFAESNDQITIERNTNFILTGKKSKGNKENMLRYYWRHVKGPIPSINEVSNDGCDVKMTAPDTSGDISFQLRVVDKVTGEEDIGMLHFLVV